MEASKDTPSADDIKMEKIIATKGPSYVPQSAVALRCRVMPPPCIQNPYIKDASETDVDPFGCWRSKCSGHKKHHGSTVGGFALLFFVLFVCWPSELKLAMSVLLHSGYNFSASAGVDSVSRYRTDFQEIEVICSQKSEYLQIL